MSQRLRTTWWTFVALLVLVPGAVNCKSPSDSAAGDANKAKAETSSEDDDEAVKDAPAGDLYPGMNFGALSPAERTKFVGIAKAEVCPCPEAAQSLHQCLQNTNKSCGLAMQVANLTAISIRKGLNETDILGKIAEFVEAARKEYDFELEGVPRKGADNAIVEIVEFADFECPHCKMASALMDQILKKYDGEVAVYFKQFPLGTHQQADIAARAALAAHEQGKFWKMHDLLFEHQRSLSPQKFQTFARRLGINVAKFKEDMQSQEVGQMVGRDRQEGTSAGITGTPAIYINGRRYLGPTTIKDLSQAIDAALAEGEKSGEAEKGGEETAGNGK